MVKRLPDSTVAPVAEDFSSSRLPSMGLLPEVQKGTIFLPAKEAPSSKVRIMRGALPHQMG